MSTRAREFVEAWIEQNVLAEPYLAEEGEDTRPSEFVSACLAEADTAGIPHNEIDEEFEDLEARIADAIDQSADYGVDRLSSNSQP